ncbi:MAG: hypothetical protein COY82_01695 [Parcubacteria group bacterium CG_4_10_14_0_8_um_filter_35_7]|nr:MAG: hypothetical protein COY82_01695 [Parcubacteria group bacterium CG_4_10_14_0_8_um_filter_35_7]
MRKWLLVGFLLGFLLGFFLMFPRIASADRIFDYLINVPVIPKGMKVYEVTINIIDKKFSKNIRRHALESVKEEARKYHYLTQDDSDINKYKMAAGLFLIWIFDEDSPLNKNQKVVLYNRVLELGRAYKKIEPLVKKYENLTSHEIEMGRLKANLEISPFRPRSSHLGIFTKMGEYNFSSNLKLDRNDRAKVEIFIWREF